MKRHNVLRILLIVILAITSIALIWFILLPVFIPFILFFIPTLEVPLYDLGILGAFRSQSFQSFNLTAPQVSVVKWEESCGYGLIFLDLNGPSVNHRGPLILDSNSQMIWTSDAYGVTINSKVQQYKGENYLTFWTGEKAATSGKGHYYMLDSSYREAYIVTAVGDGLYGDLHEFRITRDNTALLTVYNTTTADLTSMGMGRGENGWIVDSIFQEVDIETGMLLFEWRASDHFSARDSYMTNPIGGYVKSIPFDFFHINSIEKDALGNYLISARHLHMVIYIEGGSGKVLWVLGGHTSDFVDLSDGAASNFSWQHDARWVSQDDGIISLFDNGIAWPHIDAPYSQGLVIQLDTTHKTVALLHSYVSAQHARSSSQGSAQLVPAADGEPHMFIGWGSSAAFSEFAIDGQLLCETHFGASSFYFWERVKSYRAFKVPRQQWRATPASWGPAATIRGRKVYASWNGATEVAFWSLQGSSYAMRDAPRDFEEIDVFPKLGFESVSVLPAEASFSHYRVVALDSSYNVLGVSEPVIPVADRSSWFVPLLIASAMSVSLWIWYRRPYTRSRWPRRWPRRAYLR